MSWIMEFVKALPIVAITAVVAAFIGVGHSKATGLAAVIGAVAPTLICVGVVNLALGLILWRLLAWWVPGLK